MFKPDDKAGYYERCRKLEEKNEALMSCVWSI